MAYPGRVIYAFSKPLIERTRFNFTSKGKLVDIPFGYTSLVFNPSGSRNIWCESLSAKRVILSSMEGQYLGPTPSITPVNNGERSSPARIISCVSLFVCVIQQGSCLGCCSGFPKKEN